MNEYTLKNSYHFYKDFNDFKPRAGKIEIFINRFINLN